MWATSTHLELLSGRRSRLAIVTYCYSERRRRIPAPLPVVGSASAQSVSAKHEARTGGEERLVQWHDVSAENERGVSH